MVRVNRYLAMLVVLLGVVSLVIGILFIAQSVGVRGDIVEGLRAERVILGLPEADQEGYIEGDVVDTAAEAQVAQDILEEHLRDSYGTYGDTERGSPERTSYLDGTTLGNSLNLATMGFGVTTVIIGTGVFMIIVGIALGVSGVTVFRLATATR